jgi:hypothetical protein
MYCYNFLYFLKRKFENFPQRMYNYYMVVAISSENLFLLICRQMLTNCARVWMTDN